MQLFIYLRVHSTANYKIGTSNDGNNQIHKHIRRYENETIQVKQ
jgi:hypothetical protein